MKYFKIEEFVASPTAESLGIENSPPASVVESLTKLVTNVLDPLREEFGMPIYVNSGYRCEALNKAVGGVANSQHLRGEAADITTGSRAGNMYLWRVMRKLNLPIDESINENDYAWIHVSHARKNRRKYIKINR